MWGRVLHIEHEVNGERCCLYGIPEVDQANTGAGMVDAVILPRGRLEEKGVAEV